LSASGIAAYNRKRRGNSAKAFSADSPTPPLRERAQRRNLSKASSEALLQLFEPATDFFLSFLDSRLRGNDKIMH